MTITDWWALVDSRWVDLINCIETFHPNVKSVANDWAYPITAPEAERACEFVRATIDRPSVLTSATKAKEDRDHRTLNSIFNEAWFGAPESRDVYSVPGFSTLCDLCSEYEGE